MFQTILAPVDLSERCRSLLPYVAGIANNFGSRITILHVVEPVQAVPFGAVDIPVEQLWEQRGRELSTFGQSELHDKHVERVLMKGEPGHEIAAYAVEYKLQLIVMPTHGYGAVRRLILGSVTGKVLHEAGCPVWTTSHREHMTEDSGQHIERMICAVDNGPDTVCLIRNAAEVAQHYRASLRLVHAVRSDGSQADAPFQRFLLESAVETLKSLQDQAHSCIDTIVRHGAVSEVVRDAAVECDAGLCIIGRGHASKRFGSLRTQVDAIVRHSPCAVLSI